MKQKIVQHSKWITMFPFFLQGLTVAMKASCSSLCNLFKIYYLLEVREIF